MKRLFLVPALGVVGLALASPASAQFAGTIDLNRPTYADEARQPYNESRRVAYDNGYREGVKEGERDARSRDVFNYQDERTWQRADKGYHRSYGDSQRYQQIVPNRLRGRLLGRVSAVRARLRLPRQRRHLPEHARRLRIPRSERLWLSRTGRLRRARTRTLRLQPGVLERRERRIRERAARTRATATPTIRCATSGIARATTTTRAQYGPRQQYENVYRQGFKEGYERGYREWSYRR